MEKRICIQCGLSKPETDFKNEKRNSSGKMTYCADCCNLRRREWRQHNLAERTVKEKEYNSKQVKSGYCNRYYHRTRTPQNRMIMSFRALLYRFVKGRIKKSKTKGYLGCSLDELKTYLAERFSKGMSWDNYGKVWQIDHIIPCKAFDFSDEVQIHKCFHHSNLQPLLRGENISKSDKLPNGCRARHKVLASFPN